jgi:hypothetical protein
MSPVSADFVGFVKASFAREVCRFWKIWTPFFGPKAVSLRKTYGFGCARVWSCFSKGHQKRIGVLCRSLVSREPLLRPRLKTQHYVVIGVRPGALLGQNGPGTREGCTFSKSLFLVVFKKSTLYVVFCVPLGAPVPLRAPSAGAPGAQQPDQGHGHSKASFRSYLVVAGGQPREPPTAKHNVQVCRKRSSRQACVQNPCKTRGFGAMVAPPESKTQGKRMFVCFLRAAASPKRAPRRA